MKNPTPLVERIRNLLRRSNFGDVITDQMTPRQIADLLPDWKLRKLRNIGPKTIAAIRAELAAAGANPELVTEVPTTEKGNLACPFCGGLKLSRVSPKEEPKVSWIQCDTCGATGPNLHPEMTWNMRAFEEVLYIRRRDMKKLTLLK